jgi:hypothetical protein
LTAWPEREGVNDVEPTCEKPDQIAAVEALRRRLGPLDPRQIAAWRAMSPARRLEMAFQAYQFALDTVRLTERQRHPNLPHPQPLYRRPLHSLPEL